MMKRMMRVRVQIYRQPPAFMMRDRVELVEAPAQLAHTSAGQEQEVEGPSCRGDAMVGCSRDCAAVGTKLSPASGGRPEGACAPE
ncbi:hypothetical protein NQZ68_031336 [Dissostichus eleginoides]|nr:hypothetical protein NQZ68_031336 [Dissostichus eleginoides]